MWACVCTNLGRHDITHSNTESDLGYESAFCTVNCDCLTPCRWLTIRGSVGLSQSKIFRVCKSSCSQPLELVTPRDRLWPHALMLCRMDGRDGKQESCNQDHLYEYRTFKYCANAQYLNSLWMNGCDVILSIQYNITSIHSCSLNIFGACEASIYV